MRRYPTSEITTIADALYTKYMVAHSLHNTIKILHKAGKLARAERERRKKVERPKKRKVKKQKRVIRMPGAEQ